MDVCLAWSGMHAHGFDIWFGEVAWNVGEAELKTIKVSQ
jgi:hypothetical protein